jgi:hypothetical protein
LTVQEIPLVAASQTFDISLANVVYKMTLVWRAAPEGGWVLDIADSDSVPILAGIPLVTGADLLAQYAYLGFGGELIVQTDHDVDAVPTFENLGDTSHLYFVTT